jgi:ArsR family transcriptional regulator
MENIDKRRTSEVAHIFKALSNPTRLFIVEKIYKNPTCVCDLTEMIGFDTSTVSKHLTVLKNAGVVQNTKKGNMVYYSLVCDCVIDSIHNLETLIKMKKTHYEKLLTG